MTHSLFCSERFGTYSREQHISHWLAGALGFAASILTTVLRTVISDESHRGQIHAYDFKPMFSFQFQNDNAGGVGIRRIIACKNFVGKKRPSRPVRHNLPGAPLRKVALGASWHTQHTLSREQSKHCRPHRLNVCADVSVLLPLASCAQIVK